jgi:hypothetical protein
VDFWSFLNLKKNIERNIFPEMAKQIHPKIHPLVKANQRKKLPNICLLIPLLAIV